MQQSNQKPRNAPVQGKVDSEGYCHMEVRKVTPVIGAEINGVDLSRNLSDPVLEELHRAFTENLVIFFRDQTLTPEQQISFGRLFGELHTHPAAPGLSDYPEIMIIAADENSVRANGEAWHTDVSCEEEPPLGSILYIKESPPSGGDTLFANMYAAYEALSPRMMAYVHGLTATHDGEHVYRGLYADQNIVDKPNYPRAHHPIIRTHPVSGRKCLYVNSAFTTAIDGVPPEESDAILCYLFRHITHPAFQCRFQWRPGSIAFWDNRCTQHHAIWDYWPHRRYGNRVTIKGDRPY